MNDPLSRAREALEQLIAALAKVSPIATNDTPGYAEFMDRGMAIALSHEADSIASALRTSARDEGEGK